jgi:general stress protein YciG
MATKKKDPAAVHLGRRGGKKRVPKGFALMDPDRRREIARKAAAARWGKKKGR